MPGFDRTGPMGQGPMTGGGRGRCNPAGYGTPAWTGGGLGYGRGFGRGRGRGARGPYGRGGGFGRGYRWFQRFDPPTAAPDPATEVEMLKSEAEYLKQSLDAIQRRIGDLESGEPAIEE